MRPKKRILLIDTDDDCRGELKFVLEVWGFRVIQHALGEIDLIILQWPVSAGSAKRLKEANPYTPLMAIYPVKMVPSPLVPSADVVIPSALLGGRAELLDRIRVMSARKRGPRKGSIHRKSPETETRQLAATAATA